MTTTDSQIKDPHTRETLQGWIPTMASEEEIREALELAFNYRGDVTITLKDGSVIDGYLYDRHTGKSLADSYVRVLPPTSNDRRKIAYSEIAALNFSGRDTAMGKKWEDWVRNYAAKKAAGEKNIGLHPDMRD